MKKEKSALSKVVKPNDAEMNTQIARYEKRELNLKLYGLYAVVIGIIGLIISMALEESVLQLVFFVITHNTCRRSMSCDNCIRADAL